MCRPIPKDAKIYVAGHRGLVGAAIVRRLQQDGYNNLIMRTHKELDLKRQADVEAFFEAEKPAVVVIAAAKVGGEGQRETSCLKRKPFWSKRLQGVQQALHVTWIKFSTCI